MIPSSLLIPSPWPAAAVVAAVAARRVSAAADAKVEVLTNVTFSVSGAASAASRQNPKFLSSSSSSPSLSSLSLSTIVATTSAAAAVPWRQSSGSSARTRREGPGAISGTGSRVELETERGGGLGLGGIVRDELCANVRRWRFCGRGSCCRYCASCFSSFSPSSSSSFSSLSIYSDPLRSGTSSAVIAQSTIISGPVRPVLGVGSRVAAGRGQGQGKGWFRSFGTSQRSCPFRTLGIPPSSSYAQVRSSFLKLALMHHPDTASSYRSTPSSVKDGEEKYAVGGLKDAAVAKTTKTTRATTTKTTATTNTSRSTSTAAAVAKFIELRNAFESIGENEDGSSFDLGANVATSASASASDPNVKEWFRSETGGLSYDGSAFVVHSSLSHVDPAALREMATITEGMSPGGLDKGGMWQLAASVREAARAGGLPPLRLSGGGAGGGGGGNDEDRGANGRRRRRTRRR